MSLALLNGRVLRADTFVRGQCVLIENGRILDVLPADDARCRSAEPYDLGGGLLLPGFIDLQVNGGGGVLFNDAPSVESIRAIGAAHRRAPAAPPPAASAPPPSCRPSSVPTSTSSRGPSRRYVARSPPVSRESSASISKGRSSTSRARACTIQRSCASSIRARSGFSPR